MRRADVVTVNVALTDETRGLLDDERLGLLKPSAILVNTARGGIVDDEALRRRLEEGLLGGAVLDVLEQRATRCRELARLASAPNVLVTPHIALHTDEALAHQFGGTTDNVLAFLAGVLPQPRHTGGPRSLQERRIRWQGIDFAVIGGHVLLADGRLEPLNVGVRDGRIVDDSPIGPLDAEETLDVGGLTVAAGDRSTSTSTSSGATAGRRTRARPARRRRAASRPSSTCRWTSRRPSPRGASREKLAHVGDECHVDYAAVRRVAGRRPRRGRGARRGRHRRDQALHGRRRAAGDVPGADSGQILDVMRQAQRHGLTVVVHCENAEIVDFETARLQAEGRTDPAAWDEARPWYSELEAVQRVALLAEVTGCRTVIAHVTAPQSVAYVRDARAGAPTSGSRPARTTSASRSRTWPATRRLKWNPPSRDRASVERLWELARDGPRPHDRLRPRAAGRRFRAPTSGRSFPVPETGSRRCCRRRHRSRAARDPAAAGRRPALDYPGEALRPLPAQGHDRGRRRRRLCVLETNGARTLDAQELEYHEQEKWSPFDGREITVFPVYTVLRGRVIFAEGTVTGEPGHGELATKSAPVPA